MISHLGDLEILRDLEMLVENELSLVLKIRQSKFIPSSHSLLRDRAKGDRDHILAENYIKYAFLYEI